ncbi:MAG: S8 family serine peptidase [Bacteroidota bacterium]
MNQVRLSLPALVLFLGSYFMGQAQQPGIVPGEWLLRFNQDARVPPFFQALQQAEAGRVFHIKQVSKTLNIWLVSTNDFSVNEKDVLPWILRRPEIAVAQHNHYIENRSITPISILPNDPLFHEQWQYINSGGGGGVFDADLDADQAWDFTTGGITPAGDTIVVAVIDGGISPHHQDLEPNLWINRAEIPNDGIDNDQNGYKDDYHGWNVWAANDLIEGTGTTHGTPVCGIVGAVGNNGIGVTGVNWHVKMMFIAGNDNEASILEAYDYVLKSRKLYNETHGEKGAFIVAVNCSWGVNGGQPSESPLWCAAFDSLGVAGILGVAATANQAVNVDEVGDLPTACPSDYLITVTSLNRADQKAVNAAWGPINIDLGAYGHGVYTTATNNGYGTFDGTSFAAPHVSGAIALLYAASCPGLIALAKTNPGAAALFAKSLVLQSVTPIPALQNNTLSGGRLNLNNLLENYQEQCSPCQTPFALLSKSISNNSAQLTWIEAPETMKRFLRWRILGDTAWMLIENPQSPYPITGLNNCTEYEFEMMGFCAQNLSSGWSPPFHFATKGCCEPPVVINDVVILDGHTYLSWEPIGGANAYQIRVRKPQGNWMYYQSDGPHISLTNLGPCARYEAQIQTLCDNPTSIFSQSFYFISVGCGACIDMNYCAAGAYSATSEWIASVSIGDWTHASNAIPGSGYQDFTTNAFISPLQLKKSTAYPVTIMPAFFGSPEKQFYRMYIDYNGDGLFAENEIAFDPGFALADPAGGWIYVPDTAMTGSTRMRVMMKFKNDLNGAPLPCESYDFGQVEDYCVNIGLEVTATEAANVENPSLLVLPVPARTGVQLDYKSKEPADVEIYDATGRLIASFKEIHFPYDIDVNNWNSGLYWVRARVGEAMLHGKIVRK